MKGQFHDVLYWIVGAVVVFIIIFALIKGNAWASGVDFGLGGT